MKEKNGFTLIELLAIIVILAIIAVITVPIILNIIENSRKGAATDSAYGYKDAVNKYYVQRLSDNNQLKLNDTYTVTNGTLSGGSFGDPEVTSFPVQVSGTVPSSGELTYSNNVLAEGWLVIGNYMVTFNQGGTVTTVKNSGLSSNEQGNGGSSSSEQSNVGEEIIAKNWDMYYYLDEETYESSSSTTFSDEWHVWMPVNTETDDQEMCQILNNETICIELGHHNDITCSNDNCTVTSPSYLATLKNTYENNGATCTVEENEYNDNIPKLTCYFDGGFMIYDSNTYSYNEIDIVLGNGASCMITTDPSATPSCSH